jgi:glucose-6-phosphate 1-dehydrogenase
VNPAIADALVLFGATGDLAYRKLFPALRQLVARGGLSVPVIGVARRSWGIAQLREHVAGSLKRQGLYDEQVFAKLASLLHYIDGDYGDGATFDRLCDVLGKAKRPLFYLAIPPGMFPVVLQGLARIPCAGAGRVVVEKPFGRDLVSARALNDILRELFDEPAIFRIDHYLGKEPVQNLLYFRFANSFLEPIWNRNHIASVHVTMAERIGVAGRGRFYEEVGAIRDVVQNHMLQVVAHLAMEPPVGEGSEAVRDEKAKVLRSIQPLTAERLVRGQYRDYRREEGVAADSRVETFAAMRLELDSWRWAGVPFLIRAGKGMPVDCTEVKVLLRAPPQHVFAQDRVDATAINYLRFNLGPGPVAIALGARVKRQGVVMAGEGVELQFCNTPGEEMEAYERLLGDAMRGDATLFARQDSIEAAWRVVEPVLGEKTPVHPYDMGSWGPAEADAIAAGVDGWHGVTARREDRSPR